jgi:dTDP-4-amino-4,6-dideoxygalactose transaminase
MTDILASIGLVELERYESETLPCRKRIFKEYTDLLSQHNWAIIPHYIDDYRESSYHLYLLRIKEVTLEERNLIIQEIFEQDVSVNVHYKPLPMLSYYKGLGYDINNFPVANSLWECEISLPVYFSLTSSQVKEVVNAVVNAVEKIKK